MSHKVIRHIRQRSDSTSWPWVCAVDGWLAAHDWAQFALFLVMVGCWGGGWALLAVGDPPRLQIAAAGLLFIIGGLSQMFAADDLSQWRENTEWWTRVAAEGAWGSLDYGPGTYRFAGSAIAGYGVGAIAWAVWPRWDFSITLGLVSCLALWICTWFAFPMSAYD